jgi:putative transcriptional regulator
MAKNELNNYVRKMRFEHGQITQQQLADKVGVTRQTIIAIEAGKYAPSLPLAFRIAHAFGGKIEDVFQYDEPET